MPHPLVDQPRFTRGEFQRALLTTPTLLTFLTRSSGQPVDENLGTMIRRTTYHYPSHTGESQAICQLSSGISAPTRSIAWNRAVCTNRYTQTRPAAYTEA